MNFDVSADREGTPATLQVDQDEIDVTVVGSDTIEFSTPLTISLKREGPASALGTVERTVEIPLESIRVSFEDGETLEDYL